MEDLGAAVGKIIVQVVLDLCLGRGEITLREIVDVKVIVASEQVGDQLVVLAAVDPCAEASGEHDRLGRARLEGCGEVQVFLVHMAFLLHVLGTGVAATGALQAVHLIQAVPIDMRQGRIVGRMRPDFPGPCVFLEILPVQVSVGIVEIAREVAVVVRARILGVVPVKGGISVFAEAIKQRSGCLEAV